jgi:hypothetical protein
MEAIAFYFLKSGIRIALSRHPERGVAESKDLMLIAHPLLSWDPSTRLRLAQDDDHALTGWRLGVLHQNSIPIPQRLFPIRRTVRVRPESVSLRVWFSDNHE